MTNHQPGLKEETLTPRLQFQDFLKKELARRCQANPNYSLRSFARSLKVEPSSLSQIMNGKRVLTEKMQFRIGEALGFTRQDLSNFQINLPTRPRQKGAHDYADIASEQFQMIADWYHYAILELTYLKSAPMTPLWIAKKLGISPEIARVARKRLIELGLLAQNSDGSWSDKSPEGRLSHLTTSNRTIAARLNQLQILNLSSKSIETTPLTSRDHTSMTFAFDVSDLPKAIEKIANFRRQFAAEMQPRDNPTDVYQLQISFFPFTQTESKEQL